MPRWGRKKKLGTSKGKKKKKKGFDENGNISETTDRHLGRQGISQPGIQHLLYSFWCIT